MLTSGGQSTAPSSPPPDAPWVARLAGRPVVVLRGGGLGDALLTVPVLHGLRPYAGRLVLATRPAWAALLAPWALVDETLNLESAAFASLWDAGAPAAPVAPFAGAWVLSFLPDPDGALAAGLARRGAAGLLCLPPRPTAPAPVVAQWRAALGLPWDAALASRVWLPPPVPPPRPRPRLCLHPGSGSPAKNTPLALFAEVAAAWRARGGEVCWTTGEADAAVLAELRARYLAPGDRLLHQHPVASLPGELAGATAVLANDTGVAHLAGLMGLPTTVAFQTSDPLRWAPLGPRVTVLWRPRHLPLPALP